MTTRALALGHGSLIEQAVVADFIAEGHFTRHLRRMRGLYAERQAALVEAAKQYLAGRFDVQRTETGIHLVGWLPEGTDDSSHSAPPRPASSLVPCRPFAPGPSAALGSCSGSRPCGRRRSATRCSGSPRFSRPAQARTRCESSRRALNLLAGTRTRRPEMWLDTEGLAALA